MMRSSSYRVSKSSIVVSNASGPPLQSCVASRA
jgi:hypothetical protein